MPSNSEYLATKVLDGIKYDEIWLADMKIADVKDFRFSESWPRQKDDYYVVFKQFKHADIVVFSTPIYWYGISSLLKTFIDRWSESLKTDPEFRQTAKHKKIVLVLVGGDNPREKGQIIIEQFKYICEFLGMDLYATVIGEANRSLEIKMDLKALDDAKKINQIIKEGEGGTGCIHIK